MKRTLAMIATVSAIVIPPWTSASAGKAFLGGSAGESSADISVSMIDDGSITLGGEDDSDTGWKVFGGFDFLKFLGIEGGFFDLGSFSVQGISDGSGTDYPAGPVKAVAEADGIAVTLIGRIPIKRFSVYGKAGMSSWDSEANLSSREDATGITTRTREKDDGTDAVYGVGVQYDLDRFGIRLEWERYEISDVDVDLASLGIMIRF